MIPTNAVHALRGYVTGLSTTIGAVAGQVFAEALQINTSQKPAQVYNLGVNLVTSDAVAAGDNLLARLWIRRTAPEPGTARVQFNFEKATGDYLIMMDADGSHLPEFIPQFVERLEQGDWPRMKAGVNHSTGRKTGHREGER